MIGRVFLNLGLDGTMKKAFLIFLMNFIFSLLSGITPLGQEIGILEVKVHLF